MKGNEVTDDWVKKGPVKGLSSFSIITIFGVSMLLGLFFIPRLPVKLNPSRKLPVVNVSYSMWGQSARVVEMEVTSKLEAMLNRMKGVQKTDSYSGNGWGHITVRFSEHADPDLVRFEASTIIRQAWATLPEGVSYPSVALSGTDDEAKAPFLRYSVNAPGAPSAIQEYIENTIKSKLAGTPGIDRIEVTGASQKVYKLSYDYRTLEKRGVSLDNIRQAIGSSMTQEFLGMGKTRMENGEEGWTRLAFVSDERNKELEPDKVAVKNMEGTLFYLDQLVTVTREEEKASSSFRINGLNSIYLTFFAEEHANQSELSKKLQDWISDWQANLPAGYEMHLMYDASEYIDAELNKIYFRSGLTVIILLLFVFVVYRNLKYSLLIIFSLVANLCIAAIFYYLFRVEMQLYSLAGLTISLTLIIDNFIIMADQLTQQGNKKVFLAILTATLTTIGALSVIFFMGEKTRLNLLDFSYVIIINLCVSLAISLFLVPALIEKWRVKGRKKRINRRRGRLIVYFNRCYAAIIRFLCRRKKWPVLLLILLFGLPVFLLPDSLDDSKNSFYQPQPTMEQAWWVKLYESTLGSAVYKEKIRPVSDVALGGTMRLFAQKVRNGSYGSGARAETSLHVTASLPNGSTWLQMDALIREMEQYIDQYDEVRQFETNIQNGQRASIQVFFKKEFQRGSFPHQLKSKLISRSLQLGGGSWAVHGVGDGFNNDVKEQAGSSRIKLFGYNYDHLNLLAQNMRDSLLTYRRIKEVDINSEFSWYKNDYMEYIFKLDKERLAQENIEPLALYNAMSPLFQQYTSAGTWHEENEATPVRFYSDLSEKIDVWTIQNGMESARNREFRLSELASVEKSQMPRDIAKENQQYRLCLQYEYIGSYQQAWKVLERAIEQFNASAPLGYKAESETYRNWWQQDGNNQYWLLLFIFIILFFTTSILFNSWKQPFAVIFIIPLSFIGIFLTFYWFEIGFDQGGFAAFVLLSGISINVNIYLINEFNNIRKSSPRLSPLRTYIKAWNRKIRPVSLTIVSTILGFIPFMVGTHKEAFWYPLAAGTIGGLIFSFLALFLFLPMCMNLKDSVEYKNE